MIGLLPFGTGGKGKVETTRKEATSEEGRLVKRSRTLTSEGG